MRCDELYLLIHLDSFTRLLHPSPLYHLPFVTRIIRKFELDRKKRGGEGEKGITIL